MTAFTYREGNIFGVPLRNGGFSVSVIARMPRDGQVLLGYFFPITFDRLPDMTMLPKLDPQDAVKIPRFGDLSLISQKWPVIGTVLEWDRDKWKMPKFIRKDDLSRRAWLVTYADDDPNRQISIQPCPFEMTGYEKDSLLGTGFVEIMMTRLL